LEIAVHRVRELFSRPVSRETALLTMFAIIVAAAVFTMYGPFSQRTHMRQAAEHIRKIEPVLAADWRFAHVRLGAGTGHNGCLLVVGWVRSNEDRAALESFIENSSPPVYVNWSIWISSEGPAASSPESQTASAAVLQRIKR
jgi:hypothetical protein